MKDPTQSSSASIQPELVALKKLAERLASERREVPNSAHLLAAVIGTPGAADLVSLRRVTPEQIMDAARALGATAEETFKPFFNRAREIMVRMGARDPLAIHLLLGLLGERASAAHRALEHSGIDVSRLRASAMNVGLGLIGPRRQSRSESGTSRTAVSLKRPAAGSHELETAARARPTRPSTRPKGVTVPLMTASQKPKPRSAQVVELRPLPKPERAPPCAAPRAEVVNAGASRFELDAAKCPTLIALGKNLTAAAARGELDPVVGRELEVEQALDVLAKREGNNPCLIGAAGVGKTSVVRGLARRIAESQSVGPLDDRIVIEVQVAELLAGTGTRGALAARLGAIKREVAAAEGRVVLFFDEIHQLFSGDAAEEIASDLKLTLARGELPCIGATTTEEYKKTIDADPALARRFSAVEVEEPSREDAFLILTALAQGLEQHHRLRYDEDALALAVAWSIRYLPGRALPDKAVAVIDLAGARSRRRGGQRVDHEMVAEVVAELAHMPVERLLETDADRFLRLEELLGERVVGHPKELGRIARILRRNAAGLGARRPLGTFLLLGPTGVGKTETAKAVAEALFFDETAMTRLDMAEYSEAHAVAKLIGAPPGYVGHEAGGQLAEAVRRRPYQVLLLDEIEKAHSDVLTVFLGVFDEGRLTDGRGRSIDLTNTVILMTSNLGSEEAGSSVRRRVGFGSGDGSREEIEERVASAARAALAPELYNRIDEVLVFSALSRDAVREVARRLLSQIALALLAQRNVELEVEPAALDALLDAGGYDPALGARPMRRTIARLVEAPLAERILKGELESGVVVRLGARAGTMTFDVRTRAAQTG